MSGALVAGLVAVTVAIALSGLVDVAGRRSDRRRGDERQPGADATVRSIASVVAARWTDWRTSHSEASPDALAVWLDEVGRTLRRGESATVALGVVPHDRRTALDSACLRRALTRGASVAAATDEWCTQHAASGTRGRRMPALSMCSAVIACAAELGGPLAEPVDRLAAAMRERTELDRDRRTQSAQARMSALVLSCLPIAVLAVLLVTDSGVRQAIGSPLGVSLVGAGLGLDALGAWWMHHIAGARR